MKKKKAKSKRAPKSLPALQQGLDFVSMFMAAMCAGMMHDAMQKVLYAKPKSKAKAKVKRKRLRVVK